MLFFWRHQQRTSTRQITHVAAVDDPQLTMKPDATGQGAVKVTLSTLRLARPIDPELFRHLVG